MKQQTRKPRNLFIFNTGNSPTPQHTGSTPGTNNSHILFRFPDIRFWGNRQVATVDRHDTQHKHEPPATRQRRAPNE